MDNSANITAPSAAGVAKDVTLAAGFSTAFVLLKNIGLFFLGPVINFFTFIFFAIIGGLMFGKFKTQAKPPDRFAVLGFIAMSQWMLSIFIHCGYLFATLVDDQTKFYDEVVVWSTKWLWCLTVIVDSALIGIGAVVEVVRWMRGAREEDEVKEVVDEEEGTRCLTEEN